MGKRKGTLLDTVTGLKKCSCCEQYKPASNFSKNRSTKDGLQTQCKECKKIADTEYEKSDKGKQTLAKAATKYYKSEKGQIAIFNGYAKRRKREESHGNGITKEQWMEMMQFFDWKCAYSEVLVNTKNNRSIDHIIPLSKGGEHEVWNCVPMDRSLNISKQEKDMIEWYTAQDFFSKERLDKILAWQQYSYNKWSK